MRKLILIASAAILAFAQGDGGRFAVRVAAYGPKVEIRTARPTLAWIVWPVDNRTAVREVTMSLDYHPISARYDGRARAVVYTPESALAAGPHHVDCTIAFDSGSHFDQSWDFRVAPDAIQTLPSPDPQQLQVLAAVNEIRRRIGLQPCTFDDRLNLAALLHSRYLAQNKATGHSEEPGHPGFTGATGATRVAVLGWVGGSWEDVDFGSQTVAESVSSLFNAPYHRIPFLLAGSPMLGCGSADRQLTIEFGDTPDEGTTVFPSDGESDVPCAWHDYESPNPLRIHGADSRVTGYPIVLAHFGPQQRLRKMFAWLTDSAGRDIPCWLNTPLNDDRLRGGAILIPRQPLHAHTKYTAGFDGRDEANDQVRAEVTFTTGE